jgi:hypothetical protein
MITSLLFSFPGKRRRRPEESFLPDSTVAVFFSSSIFTLSHFSSVSSELDFALTGLSFPVLFIFTTSESGGSIIFFGKSEQTRKHNLLWKIRTDQEAELSLENLSGTGSIIFGKFEHLPAGSRICGKI